MLCPSAECAWQGLFYPWFFLCFIEELVLGGSFESFHQTEDQVVHLLSTSFSIMKIKFLSTSCSTHPPHSRKSCVLPLGRRCLEEIVTSWLFGHVSSRSSWASFHQSENQVVNHFSFSPFNSLSLPSSCVHSYMVPLSSQLCVSVIHFSSENDFSLFFFPTENRKFKAFRWLMALDFD